MKLFITFCLLSFFFIACDENQQVIKKLDGTWEVTHYNQEPVNDSTPLLFSELTFNECKLSESEYCDGSMQSKIFGTTLSIPLEYNVQNEGNQIAFKVPSTGFAEIDSVFVDIFGENILLEIVSLENKNLKVQYDGSVLDLEKIE